MWGLWHPTQPTKPLYWAWPNGAFAINTLPSVPTLPIHQNKLPCRVFDNGVDWDAHVKAFTIVATMNGVESALNRRNIYGTTLWGSNINLYMSFNRDEPLATIETLGRKFHKCFGSIKSCDIIITKSNKTSMTLLTIIFQIDKIMRLVLSRPDKSILMVCFRSD